MKKYLLSAVVLLSAAAAFAQEQQTEANPQAPQTVVVVRKETPAPVQAAAPVAQVYDWRTRRQSVSISVGLPSIYATGFGSHSWDFYIPASGASSSPRSEIFCGAWSVDYGYNILWWLRLGAGLSYECWAGKAQTHDMSLSARVDFTYINREHVVLYSGLSAGIGMHLEHYTNGDIEGMYLPAVNVTPIGLNFGSRKVYGLVETNIGSASVLRVGVGFRP
ncbi:MAG: hypothetical protein J5688_06510 [Paludibacteraceae bacterium]|nr:hypothetical protein [Paludibacteraceae bacterium]